MLDLENQEWLLSITELFHWNGILEWAKLLQNAYFSIGQSMLIHSVASIEVLYVACREVLLSSLRFIGHVQQCTSTIKLADTLCASPLPWAQWLRDKSI